MKKQSLQQAYKLFLENSITRSQLQKIFYSDSFARKFVTPANSLEDSIKILKTKRILSEEFTPGYGDQTNEPFKENLDGKQQYAVYLISLSSNKIVGGYATPDEARAAAPALGQTLGKLKLTTGNNLKSKYGIDPLDSSNWAELPNTDPAPTSYMEDKIEGGLADDPTGMKVDPNELALGITTEMEHTDDPKVAAEIALDHLMENPKYYTALQSSNVEPTNELDDISEMIDKMLGEYRDIIKTALEEADLPDSYDDDLKAAGLAEDQEVK